MYYQPPTLPPPPPPECFHAMYLYKHSSIEIAVDLFSCLFYFFSIILYSTSHLASATAEAIKLVCQSFGMQIFQCFVIIFVLLLYIIDEFNGTQEDFSTQDSEGRSQGNARRWKVSGNRNYNQICNHPLRPPDVTT